MIRLLLASLASDIRRRWLAASARRAREHYVLQPAACHVSCQATARFQRVYVGAARR
jgi:hypothetical protein